METVFEPYVLPELTESATADGREVSGGGMRGLGSWRRGGRGSDMSDEASHTPMGREEGERRTECKVNGERFERGEEKE